MKRCTIFAGVLLTFGVVTGCGQVSVGSALQNPVNQSSNRVAKSVSGKALSVLYAGSMTSAMEQKIKQNVSQSLGLQFEGEGKGSNALAQMIRSGISRPDVFISASPSADKTLMGAANHDLVSWYVALAQDQLVIAYSPKSKFATQLHAAADGQKSWYQVLEEPGFRLGRTDARIDPKGASTLFMFELASSYYHQPQLKQTILGDDENPNQVFPEEALLSQLTTGQVDAIIAYKHEAVEWGVPYVTLPDAVNLGNVKDAPDYAKVSMTVGGKVEHGAPILFTITIPKTAGNEAGAEAFVKYMVSGHGHDILMKEGFTPISAQVGGSKEDVPQDLQSLVQGTMK